MADVYEEAGKLLGLDRDAAKRWLYQVAYSTDDEGLTRFVVLHLSEAQRAVLRELFPDEVSHEAAVSIIATWRKHKAAEIIRALNQPRTVQ